jgi:DnaK suppressor protein
MKRNSVDQYSPNENEEYMNARQLVFFKTILQDRRQQLLEEINDFKQALREVNYQVPDMIDMSNAHAGAMAEYHSWEHQMRSIVKIDAALARIEDGSYGYCAESGDEIGLKRLLVQPTSILSVEEQERMEAMSTRMSRIASTSPAGVSMAF